MKFTRKIVVQAVTEATIGVDPGSGYTAILTNVGTTIKGAGNELKRDVVRSSFTPEGYVLGSVNFACTLPIELKGGGVNAGVPVDPETDVFLQACGLAKSDALVITVDAYNKATHAFAIGEVLQKTAGGANIGTIFDVVDTNIGTTATLYLRNITVANIPAADAGVTGATSAAAGDTVLTTRGICYRPSSDRSVIKTAAIHYNLDGIQHVATGCRGTATLDLSVGKYGTWNFSMQGTYSDPTDVALPSVSYSTIIPPPVYAAGLVIGAWDMTKTATEQLTIDLGNTVTPRNDINATMGIIGYEITGREPKGTLNPEVSALSDYNAWNLWKTSAYGTIYCQIGATAGNRCRVLVPAAAYTSVDYQDRNGISAYNLAFTCTEGTDGTGGDNELYFMFT